LLTYPQTDKSLHDVLSSLFTSNLKVRLNQTLDGISLLNNKPYKTCKHKYEVCLKSNGTVHAARKTFIAEKKALLHEKLLLQRKKHCFLWCHNVLWFRKPNFSIVWKIHSFLHVFLSRHFLCNRFV